MGKKEKTAGNNQWTSVPEKSSEDVDSFHRKKKTSGDNQWTSTLKNNK